MGFFSTSVPIRSQIQNFCLVLTDIGSFRVHGPVLLADFRSEFLNSFIFYRQLKEEFGECQAYLLVAGPN